MDEREIRCSHCNEVVRAGHCPCGAYQDAEPPTDEERFAAWKYVGGHSGYHHDGEPADLQGDVVTLLDGLARALRERGTARQWVHDLQSGMYINCVYCGHRYGPSDEVPATMADALKEHVEQCAKHPMSALKADRDKWRKIAHQAEDAAAVLHTELERRCDECDKPFAVVRHCLTKDCAANCGEAIRWDEQGFERGAEWMLRVLESGNLPNVHPLYDRMQRLRGELGRG